MAPSQKPLPDIPELTPPVAPSQKPQVVIPEESPMAPPMAQTMAPPGDPSEDSSEEGEEEEAYSEVPSKYRGFLMYLYTVCRISDEIINNMIHIINNPELYEDEIVNAIVEMWQHWARTDFHCVDQIVNLKKRLTGYATTYFKYPKQYLKPPEELPVAPPQIPLPDIPGLELPEDTRL